MRVETLGAYTLSDMLPTNFVQYRIVNQTKRWIVLYRFSAIVSFLAVQLLQ
jgi:hypothetical protein